MSIIHLKFYFHPFFLIGYLVVLKINRPGKGFTTKALYWELEMGSQCSKAMKASAGLRRAEKFILLEGVHMVAVFVPLLSYHFFFG